MGHRTTGRAGAATLLMLVLAASAFLGCAREDTAEPGTVDTPGPTQVRIGFIGPLEGDDALHGQGMRRAAELAIKEANNSEEVRAAGYEFVLVAEDCGVDPQRAVDTAEALAEDVSLIGVIGHLDAECSLSAAHVYQEAGVAMVSVSSAPELTAQNLSVVNRIVTRDDIQAETAAEMLLEDLGLTEVAVVDDSTAYGTWLRNSFTEAFASGGGKPTVRESIPAEEPDLEELLTMLEELEPRAVYYVGTYTKGALISKHVSEAGLDIPLVGDSQVFCDEYIEIAGPENAEGDMSTMPGLPLDRQARGQDFQASYIAEYGSSPKDYDSYAYDAAALLVQAVLDVGPNRQSVVRAIRDMTFHGVTGVTQFDEYGDKINQEVSVFRVTDGEWTELID